MDYSITALSPPLDGLTAGVDEEWLITAVPLDVHGEPYTVELVDENGQPRYDENGQPMVGPAQVPARWWTSGGWNYYPPQAYGPDGNRLPQWEDPPGSGQFTSDARTATWDELEPMLRQYVCDPAVAQWEARQPQQ